VNTSEIDYDGNLDLIKAAIKVMNLEFGFDLSVSCDFPEGSGMGGSAALVAAVIGCLNEFREEKLDAHAIAEYAFEAERIELDIKGGWQDQYSTVFGGFNCIEFDKSRNTVTPLRLQLDVVRELEERFLLCFSGKSHLGHTIQAKNHGRNPSAATSLSFASGLKDIVQEMRTHLLRGQLSDFGRMLDETWNLKKSYDPRVTDENLDAIYDLAMQSGADGGRLLGTGGGGYFLFLAKPFERYRIARALEERGLKTQSVVFDDKGLQSWTARP
jgi:D-glycero-alpha-D-manno-heptose-7-phosphate kinase